ncbi:terminase large subunit [Pukyongiella litopenaei]|uniref:terminase large subunit n=1 Tax=Pukyongiella litopenaei TaxID=2605946 RepID=UPI00313C08BA
MPDWADRITSGRSLIPELPLIAKSADRAVSIFKRLRVPDLIGTPTYGEVCEPWVIDLVRVIFGSYDPDTRRRMIREFFLLVPKKNGKSAIAAGIIVTAAILNERPMAELVLIAPTQKISGIAFNQARGIIANDPTLSDLFHVQGHMKQITHRVTGASIMILSADGDVVTGSKATFILIDETHVLASKAKAPEIFLELRGGLASRPEGFLLQITTQSKVEPVGQFKKELMKARQVRDGAIRLPVLPILYEFPREIATSERWRDEATWGLVNPNLEVSVSLDYLRDEMLTAEQDGQEALALFASQHLNVEIGIGLHSARWIGADYWPSCADPTLELDELLDRCDVAVVGGDMGGADDLASLAVLGRCRETKHRLAWVRAWCARGVLERHKEIAPKLLDLENAGDLVIDDDPVQHVRDMADICERVRDCGLFPETEGIGLDPWGVAALLDELQARGFDLTQIYGVGQGYKLNGAIKGLERRLMDGTQRHGGQPIMTWCVGNAKAEARGNNVLITKARAGVSKIDPLIALFNATILMDMNPEPPGGGIASYFEHLEAMA